MDISPQRVRTAEFQTAKRGLDPDEVRAFLEEVATELERAQNQSTAMEARARAAVARLQEISESTPSATASEPAQQSAPDAGPAEITPSVDQAETISRTLLLAQRTADQAVAEAEAEAERLRSDAETEAERSLESSRQMSERMLDEARDEARRTGDAERIKIESEVNALLARRDFLESDVDHLQTFLIDERNRLRDAASSILEVADRVPAGLGEVRRPLLSAADDEVATRDDATDAATPDAGADSSDDVVADDVHDDEALPDDADTVGDASDTDDDSTVGEIETTREIGRTDASAPAEGDQLVIRTDIADEGPSGSPFDHRDR